MGPLQVISTELARATIRILISWSELKYCYYLALYLALGEFGAVCGNDSSLCTCAAATYPDQVLAAPWIIEHLPWPTLARFQIWKRRPSLMPSDLATLTVPGVVLTTSVPSEPGIGIKHQVRPYVKGVPLLNLVKRDPELDAINTGTNAPITVDALVRQIDPPFMERVLRTRISSKFKLPTQLGIYEGKTDPMDHLDSYKSLMSLQGCSDEVMCKAFSATLKGPASDKVIIMAMMEGLRPGPLFDSLSKNVPETLSALQSKADKYIAAEELAEAKRRRRGKEDHKRKEPDTRRADYKEEMRYKRPDRDSKRSNNRRPRTLPRRPEFNLPPLNTPVAQVLSEIKHEEFIKWPGKIKTDPQKRNRNKYCEFHRDHGHNNTEDCFQLKEQIADLIKRGYLRKYIADRPPPNSPKRKYSDNRPTAGNIQTIHRGFGSGGCSTASRKRHARSAFRSVEEEVYNLSSPCVSDQPPITFSSDDLRGLHLPHDDALVVSAVIANFNVQRILIDSGSSADILFISAFEKMKIGLDKLQPFHTPLIGFGGNTTHPLGWINLPITLGTEPQIKAITSTYHLKMKFPTLTGIGEVKGNQKVARQCFISAMKTPRETENTKPLEEVVPISIHPNYPERQVMIGTELTDELHIALTDFLKKNSDVFAWSQGDVPGIDPEIAMHKLFTKPDCSPVHQKRRKFAPERLKAHSIIVLTDQPLKQILQRPDTSGRLLKWSIELSEFHVEYKPRTTIKAQALSDLIVESTHEDTPQPETTPLEAGIPKEPTSEQNLAHWILYVDGSSNQHGCGAGLVLRAPSGEQMEYAIRMEFQATNNEAEYEALLAGLRVATELGAQSLEVFSDSQLVVNQVQGDYLAKDSRMIAYLGEVKTLSSKIKEFKINQIPREDNKKADALANLASTFEFISDRNLKARLERSKSEWAEDLPSILWAYHTTSRIPTGETPYSMVFGTESVIPVEIGVPSFRTLNFNEKGNEGELRLNLDLLDEKRERAELHQAAYKSRIAKYYNERVKHRSFLPGDLVLRRVTLSTRDPSAGKLGPTWEGPYKVIKVSRPGTCWLEDLDGKALSHPWNAEHLKKYYQ
ncbi:hypothetical protein Acr_00g0037010 [Actinidia rufa]|uniref:RNase H type-1 domain-containing protein n=1 Tax=Actinidia rufa TaxID=165716 RepID=A0A7J0DGR0_9ERIC|nr:hypothetical protein Acr_00g0037010 [Actinidia rufa]